MSGVESMSCSAITVRRSFITDRGDQGRRLDHVVVRHLADLVGLGGLSRTRVQRWVEQGRVSVEARRASRAAQRVMAGRRVEVEVPDVPRTDRGVSAQDIPLSILYEDDHLVAIDKPAGLIVHPSYGHRDGTLINALAYYARRWPFGRPSLVHRLDKHTSGVLLVAKSRESHAALVRALGEPDARKEYLALCYGRMRRARKRVRLPLGRDPYDRRRVVVREGGAEAVTEITRVAQGKEAARGVTLVLCRLLTGRMHQIRVHLQAEGLPVVGDPVYRADPDPVSQVRDAKLAAALRSLPRQALHAWRLSFRHPASREWLRIEAPMPADLGALLGGAGLVPPL